MSISEDDEKRLRWPALVCAVVLALFSGSVFWAVHLHTGWLSTVVGLYSLWWCTQSMVAAGRILFGGPHYLRAAINSNSEIPGVALAAAPVGLWLASRSAAPLLLAVLPVLAAVEVWLRRGTDRRYADLRVPLPWPFRLLAVILGESIGYLALWRW